ncbi:MAG: cytochrome c [Gammaproteobacteria bacterium]|jgi:mono/diheme cytochrome c family protein
MRGPAGLALLILLAACSDHEGAAPPQKTGAARPGETVSMRVPGKEKSGRELFRYWCMPCHGAGPGHAGTQALGRLRGKDQAVLLQRHNLTADYVKHVVRNGFQMMPPFRYTEITGPQLDRIAAYVSSNGKKD